MVANKEEDKSQILEMCKKIDEDIIFSYQSLKQNNFYRSWKNQEGFVSSSGDKDNHCFKEFSMKEQEFNFRLRTLKFPYEDRSYENQSMIEKAVNSFNQKGDSYQKINTYFDRIKLDISEKNGKLIEGIWIIKIDDFSNVADFYEKSCKKYADSYLESILAILSNLPTDVMKAYQAYSENFKKSPDAKSNTLANRLQENLDKFKQFKDYMLLYEQNPPFFLEQLKTVPKEQQEDIIKKLVKNKNYKANKEVDDILSRDYGPLIGEVFRKDVKRDKGV